MLERTDNMLAKALKQFRDKYTGQVYEEGGRIALSPERFAEMNQSPYGQLVREEPESEEASQDPVTEPEQEEPPQDPETEPEKKGASMNAPKTQTKP